MKEHSSLTGATAMLTAVGLLSQAMAFCYRAALSRLVGAETMGLYQLIMPVYAVIQAVIMSGLAVALSSLSAAYTSKGNQKAATQLLYSALRGLFLLWIPAALAVILCSEFLSGAVLGDFRTRPGLLLLMPVLLLTGVENLHKHHFYGMGETRIPARVELAEQFLRTGAILGLLLVFLPVPQSHAVALIVVGMLISEVFSSLTLVVLRLRREGRLSHQRGAGETPSILRKKLLEVAIPVSGAALLNNLIVSVNSVLIPRELVRFGMMEGEAMEQFGVVFGMTLPLLMLPFAFVNALSLALLPRLTHCMACGQSRKLLEQAECALRWISMLLLPLLAFLVPCGGDIGRIIFEEQRVGMYLLPLAAAVALSAYEGILSVILNAVGKQSVSAAVNVLCGGVQLFFTLFGVQRWGMSACLMGMLVEGLLGVLLRFHAADKAIGLRVDGYTCFFAPALSASFMGVWMQLLYQRMRSGFLPLSLTMILCGAAGGMLYCLALCAQGVSPFRLTRCKNSSQSSTQRKRISYFGSR